VNHLRTCHEELINIKIDAYVPKECYVKRVLLSRSVSYMLSNAPPEVKSPTECWKWIENLEYLQSKENEAISSSKER